MPAAKLKTTKSTPAPRPRSFHLPRKADIVRKFGDLPPLRPDGTRLLSKREVIANVNLTFPTIIDRMRRGEFPLALEVGERPMWRESEIFAWLASLPRRAYPLKQQ